MRKSKLANNFESMPFSVFHTFNLIITISLVAIYFSGATKAYSQNNIILVFSLFFVFLFLALDYMTFINYSFGLFLYIFVLFSMLIILDFMNILNEEMSTMLHLIPISLGILFIKKYYKLFLAISCFLVIIISFFLNYPLQGKIIIIIFLIAFLYSLIAIRNWFIQLESSKKAVDKKVNRTTLKILGRISEMRDTETAFHLSRVEIIIEILANRIKEDRKYSNYLNNSYVEDLKAAAYLHDVGKIGISDSILLKPGILTEQEFSIMKTHTLVGYDLLKDAMKEINNQSLYDLALVIARNHHEKWNGSGYPDNLIGNSIPFSARIMAIVDVYDALVSRRPYKDPFTHEEAVDIIKRDSGIHFDPDLVQHFIKVSDLIDEKMKMFVSGNSYHIDNMIRY